MEQVSQSHIMVLWTQRGVDTYLLC